MTTAANHTVGAAPAPAGGQLATRGRLRSLDAVRGLAIVIMLMNANPGAREYLWEQLKHPVWEGLHFADLFFPLFLFAIGTSVPFSRRAGSPVLVARRVAMLAALGIGLTYVNYQSFRPSGVLQHIAISYLVAYLILRLPRRWQIGVSVALVGGAWLASVLWPGEGGDPFARSETVADVVNHATYGYSTTEGVFQSVVSSVTIIAGVFAGQLVKDMADRRAAAERLAVAAAVFVAGGLLISLVVPLNKHLWTPSFAVLVIGTSLGFFALAYWLIDVRGSARWATPLVELGMNPIAVYVVFMAGTYVLRKVTDLPSFAVVGSYEAGALAYAIAWTTLGWLFAHWLHRKRWYLKI
jgi:predicted acyltransferase